VFLEYFAQFFEQTPCFDAQCRLWLALKIVLALVCFRQFVVLNQFVVEVNQIVVDELCLLDRLRPLMFCRQNIVLRCQEYRECLLN